MINEREWRIVLPGGRGGGTKRKMDVRMLYIVEIFPTRGKFYRVVNEIFSRRYDI